MIEVDKQRQNASFFLVRKITITKLGVFLDFPGGPVVKNLPISAEDTVLAQEDPTCHGGT